MITIDIYTFCEDVKAWLDENEENIAVIHCKAGKGRTGLMICCWLLYVGDWGTAADAMKFYAAARTLHQKGVTIPSQIRYIQYFEKRMKYGPPRTETVFLSEIVFHGMPKNIQELKFTICKALRHSPERDRADSSVPLFHCKKKIKDLLREDSAANREEGDHDADEDDDPSLPKLVIPANVPLCGDIKFDFEKLLHFWVNTGFVEDNKIVLRKHEIDKACKDTKDKNYPANFKVVLRFKSQDEFLGKMGVNSTQGMMMPFNINISSDATTKKAATASQLALKKILLNYPSLQNL
jgi:phosphatidylinositol-3,4,5-trisphosphate 3-phosphatase/dual-specificity protein phosphatase PTEN